ncbi:MAG TPA: hypothetical protein PLB49_05360 [Chitinophagaceae bacterium]|nr:hypothetical protein [Chitinophagaceae bacterium]HPH31254.1 hypothetical protein [Chitinophagaceae bacterium]
MKRNCLVSLLLLVFFFSSCKEEETEFSVNSCSVNPPFVESLGYEPQFAYFSTSDIRTMGLVLNQSKQKGNPASPVEKSYQHPSWRKAGWLAPIQLDNKGNLFTAPAPFINVLNNPIAGQNTIWKVNGSTGVMDPFIALPMPDTSLQHPFGIIGLAFLCETNTLYASTLAGSDRLYERGGIYAIDAVTGKITDQLMATDAMGMGISYITGKRCLYYGTGRSSDVFSVELDSKGRFSGKPEKVFSIAGMGPSGDDKVRRIRTDNMGNLFVYGMSFNYNLIPQREKKETVYSFLYDAGSESWISK